MNHPTNTREHVIDLERWLNVELPPCQMTTDDTKCNAPSVIVANPKCTGCQIAEKSALCRPCYKALLHRVSLGLVCADCGSRIALGGETP